MKTAFAKTWNRSVQTRKQRKYRYNAPLHVRHKFMGVHLEAGLRKTYGVRTLAVRKGDTVKVVRGQYKGKTGKVDRVDLQYTKVFIASIAITKKDGSKALIPQQPSNLVITSLDMSDDKRIASKTADAPKKEAVTKKV
jgi:large subunit ribosomal protein L24